MLQNPHSHQPAAVHSNQAATTSDPIASGEEVRTLTDNELHAIRTLNELVLMIAHHARNFDDHRCQIADARRFVLGISFLRAALNELTRARKVPRPTVLETASLFERAS